MITFDNISIIIPVTPAENALKELLKDLRPIEREAEIIIIEGSQRARQLNVGAQKATRDFLWFLHADSRFGLKTLPHLLKSLNQRPDALHYFNLRFLPDGPPVMFINEIGCWVRSRILGVPFGDQGFCLSRSNFLRVGGFPENVQYGEDHLFVWRARQNRIQLQCAGAVLYTSARRYVETGWFTLTWKYARLWTRQAWPEWKKMWVSPFSLIVFAKYPEPGKVKSRLARTIGAVGAAGRYREMVEIVIQKTDPLPPTPSLEGRGKGEGEYHRILCFDPPQREDDFKKWFPSLEITPQCDGDLGQRMSAAFQESLANGSKRAVLIGTDCIDIDHGLILKAMQCLDNADLVLGPAKDGGYYLIGCKKVYPELFAEIDWSTDRVLSQTLKMANNLKLSVSLLPELEDIDTMEQYEKFREKIRKEELGL